MNKTATQSLRPEEYQLLLMAAHKTIRIYTKAAPLDCTLFPQDLIESLTRTLSYEFDERTRAELRLIINQITSGLSHVVSKQAEQEVYLKQYLEHKGGQTVIHETNTFTKERDTIRSMIDQLKALSNRLKPQVQAKMLKKSIEFAANAKWLDPKASEALSGKDSINYLSYASYTVSH